MAKQDTNVTKLNKNTILIEKLKLLTEFLIQEKRYENQEIFTKEEFNKNIKYRLFNYFLFRPKIIQYINEYLNDNKYFDKLDNQTDWINTFIKISQINKIKKKDLNIARFQFSKRDEIYNKLRQKFDNHLTFNELENFYKLYINNVINKEDLNLYNDNTKNTKSNNNNYNNYIDHRDIMNLDIEDDNDIIDTNKYIQLSEHMKELRTKFFNYINSNSVCKKCLLYKNEKDFVITNIANIEEEKADFIFISDENFKDYKNILRDIINMGEKNKFNYVLTRTFPCINDDNTLSNKENKEVLNNCSKIMEQLLTVFEPKYYVLFGNNAKNILNIKQPITKIQGEIIKNKIVLNNLSKIKPGSKAEDLYATTLRNVSKLSSKLITKDKIENSLSTIADTNNINNNNSDYSLFDIKILENKILYIMVDDKGNKKYITDDVKFPIYIKYGDYQNCMYIDSEVDFYSILTNQQKNDLTKTLIYNLNSQI